MEINDIYYIRDLINVLESQACQCDAILEWQCPIHSNVRDALMKLEDIAYECEWGGYGEDL